MGVETRLVEGRAVKEDVEAAEELETGTTGTERKGVSGGDLEPGAMVTVEEGRLFAPEEADTGGMVLEVAGGGAEAKVPEDGVLRTSGKAGAVTFRI